MYQTQVMFNIWQAAFEAKKKLARMLGNYNGQILNAQSREFGSNLRGTTVRAESAIGG